MRSPRSRRLTVVALAAILALPGLLARAPAARAAEACFPQTGQCVQEPFLSYWLAHGGLAINGFPLSTASPEKLEDGKVYTVQYFERARYELHPENAGTPYEVLLGQFGRIIYLTDPSLPLATAVAPAPGATYFNATGHNLGGGFRAYWEANGGLAQFGYPISEELREQLEDGKAYTVQYFERARLEWHPENPAPYDVLLGQFGRRILAARSPVAPSPFPVMAPLAANYSGNPGMRARLALPTAPGGQVAGAVQHFQQGWMLWRGDTGTIYVLVDESSLGSVPIGSASPFADTWDPSQPVGGGQVGPGLWEPQRGFGKVWRDNPQVRQRLGYATTATEQGQMLSVQPFVGGLAVHAPAVSTFGPGGILYIVYTNGRYELQYRCC